jgi:hypothetical protein
LKSLTPEFDHDQFDRNSFESQADESSHVKYNRRGNVLSFRNLTEVDMG